MRASALLERYRMALEVIANGPSFEPGTRTARMALTPPDVSAERAKHPLVRVPALEQPESDGLSVRQAVELAREAAFDTGGEACRVEPEPEPEPDEESEPDDEPEPIDLAEIDEELDEEEAEPEAPKRWVREKLGADGLTDTQRAVLTFIRDRGEVNKAMVADAIPSSTDDKVRRGLKILRERGLIVAEGENVTRTYKPVVQRSEAREATEAGQQREAATLRERIDAVVARQDKPTMPEEPASEPVADAGRTDGYTVAGMPAVQAEVKRNGVGSDEGRLLESVRFKPNWSIAQHAGRLDLHQDRVSRAMRKLEDEGEVRSSPHGGRVVWNVR